MYVTWETILTRLNLLGIALCDLPLNCPRTPRRKTPVFIWGRATIGRFALYECDVALIIVAGR